jgi:hypothetical protein
MKYVIVTLAKLNGDKAGAPSQGMLFVNVTGCSLIDVPGVWIGAATGKSLS